MFQLFEDALEDAGPSDKAASTSTTTNGIVKKVKTSNKEKVGRKLSKFRMKDKAPKNGTAENDDSCQMTLSECLEEAHLAVEMFLNNNFEEARNIVQPL